MNKQSFITILLTLLLSMTGAKTFAHDIEVANDDGVTIYYIWINNNTELTVSYRGSSYSSYSNEYSGIVVIPESVKYNGNTYPVTSIGNDAFSNCNGLTSITIPNSVTSIDERAFYNCISLYRITIPNSIKSIGACAFQGSGLKAVISEIDEPFEISNDVFSDYSISIPRLYVPYGTKSAYQSTAGWDKIFDIVEISGKIGKNVFYSYDNKTHTLTISGEGPMYSLDDEIYYPWFWLSVDNLEIESGVTSIGSYAFLGQSLTSVTFPNSVTSIGGWAFKLCDRLTSITIPKSLTYICGEDFECSSLKTFIVEEGHPKFDSRDNCNAIIETESNKLILGGINTTIPKSVTSIAWDAFFGRHKLTSVISEIENPFVIDNSVFNGTSSDVQLIVPKGKKTAYQSTSGWNVISNIFEAGEIGLVFEVNGISYEIMDNNTVTIKSGKNAYGNVIIPNQVSLCGTTYNVTSISSGSFRDCDNIFAITIPNSVTSIGSNAFRNCSNLVSVIIGSGVTSIGSNAFYNTTLAKTIWLTNTLPSGYNTALGTVNYVSNDQFNISNKVVYKFLSSYFEVDGIRYVPVSPSDHTCDAIDCVYDESAENINIGETVTYKNITLTVMNVNPFTCYQNKYIKDANISLVGNIGKYAFYGCTGLKTAAIKNQGSVGDYAFSSCSAMETAELGQKVTSIGTSSFTCCSKLKSIIIPDAVNSVGSSAFTGCEAMTSAKIGNGVETISEYAFSACSSLKVLKIGSGVKTINKYAFSGCSSLPSIVIPKSVTNINNSVFNNCTSLAKIIIADSENTLTLGSNKKNSYDYGNPLFSSCPLDSVYIGRDISYSTSSSYGYSPFYRNTSLRAVKITNKETEISENEFYGCTNLQKVIIGDGVTTIGNWAFSGCQSLKFFAFGTQVANIGQNAFSDCTALIEISSKATTPPECGSQALDDINKWDCKLYVPDGCYDAYHNAEQWKEFFFIDEGEGTIVIDDEQAVLLGDANNDGEVDIYDIDAIVDYIMTGDINGINFKNADMNKDGKVNAADIVVLNTKLN